MNMYQKMKAADGIKAIYTDLTSIQEKIDELNTYLNLLNKYTGGAETIERAKQDIEKFEDEKINLLNKKFFCVDCGGVLKREERIYCSVGSNWEVNGYPMWDTYLCSNCGYFTWDKNSRRSSGLNGSFSIPRDPRYHGTMDGHPRFDNDHKTFHENKKLESSEGD